MLRRQFVNGVLVTSAGLAWPGHGLAQDTVASAHADTALPVLAPVVYVGHGGPNLATSEVRGPELRDWGAGLGRPSGIISITPHYRARGVELGCVGTGRGLRSFPRRFRRMAEGVDYRTPDNSALVARLDEALSERSEVARSRRTGFDHTSWMPLFHLFPQADIPVIELALPFVSDRELFALGGALAPLRREGVLLHCSGNLTHNIAAMGRGTSDWARRFDAWVVSRLEGGDVDALVDWRTAAPDPYLAHPDDGGHYDVLIIGLGALAESGGIDDVTFPVTGFELDALSKRCIELR